MALKFGRFFFTLQPYSLRDEMFVIFVANSLFTECCINFILLKQSRVHNGNIYTIRLTYIDVGKCAEKKNKILDTSSICV